MCTLPVMHVMTACSEARITWVTSNVYNAWSIVHVRMQSHCHSIQSLQFVQHGCNDSGPLLADICKISSRLLNRAQEPASGKCVPDAPAALFDTSSRTVCKRQTAPAYPRTRTCNKVARSADTCGLTQMGDCEVTLQLRALAVL
jgi:hypothetical protein